MTFHIPRVNKRVWMLISWIPVGIVVSRYEYTIKTIKGTSMQPTLNPEPRMSNDVVFCERINPKNVQRGDIVILRSPIRPSEHIVKRVIALQGDTVQTLPPYPEREIEVPPGNIWIEGDESFRTWDSNTWGPVPLGLLECKVISILWPLSRFGLLTTSNLNERKDTGTRPHNSLEMDKNHQFNESRTREEQWKSRVQRNRD